MGTLWHYYDMFRSFDGDIWPKKNHRRFWFLGFVTVCVLEKGDLSSKVGYWRMVDGWEWGKRCFNLLDSGVFPLNVQTNPYGTASMNMSAEQTPKWDSWNHVENTHVLYRPEISHMAVDVLHHLQICPRPLHGNTGWAGRRDSFVLTEGRQHKLLTANIISEQEVPYKWSFYWEN